MTGWEYHPEECDSKANSGLILKKPFELEELDQALEKLLSEIHKKRLDQGLPQKNASSDPHIPSDKSREYRF
jgi:hypothetical protein